MTSANMMTATNQAEGGTESFEAKLGCCKCFHYAIALKRTDIAGSLRGGLKSEAIFSWP